MDKAVTVGGVVWFIVVVVGCLGVAGAILFVLSILAKGFTR